MIDPLDRLTDTRLTAQEYRVYAYLCTCANAAHKVQDVTLRDIGEAIGIHECNVSRAVASLRAKMYITANLEGWQGCYEYKIMF